PSRSLAAYGSNGTSLRSSMGPSGPPSPDSCCRITCVSSVNRGEYLDLGFGFFVVFWAFTRSVLSATSWMRSFTASSESVGAPIPRQLQRGGQLRDLSQSRERRVPGEAGLWTPLMQRPCRGIGS